MLAITALLASLAVVTASPLAARDIQNGRIHPSVNLHKCIDIPGNNQYDGATIQLYDCNGTPAQSWDVSANQIKLTNTNFCLSAGGGPTSGTRLFISACGGPGQNWVQNGDGFQLEGSDLCVDLNNDNTDNGNFIQAWSCGDQEAQNWVVSGQ